MPDLIFTNKDAVPKESRIVCDAASVPLIMRWYGSFFAGDRYSVTYDGEKVPMDRDGDMLQPKEGPT